MTTDTQKTPEPEAYVPPSGTALRRIVTELNLDKSLKWDSIDEALEQFHALVKNPPFRSVVIRFSPKVAERLLRDQNERNRPLQTGHSTDLTHVINDDMFELTGDSIKISKTGIILDGQHRLNACRRSGKPLTTHVVFGLEDDIFDVIDQGKKRSPGDVLALLGVPYANMVASGVRQALSISAGSKGSGPGTTRASRKLTARMVAKYALGSMKGVQDWAKGAAEINMAYKQPPSMITAILYLISKGAGKSVAEDFQHSWVHGNRLNRNKNFDVLNGRLMEVARASGGHVPTHVRAALIIQTFNHWHAGLIANPRAITWTKNLTFPKLEFDADSMRKRKQQEFTDNTSLPASQDRLLLVFGRHAAKDKDGNVALPIPALSKLGSVPRGNVSYVLGTMEAAALLHCVRRRCPDGPAIFRLKEKGVDRLRALATNGSGHES